MTDSNSAKRLGVLLSLQKLTGEIRLLWDTNLLIVINYIRVVLISVFAVLFNWSLYSFKWVIPSRINARMPELITVFHVITSTHLEVIAISNHGINIVSTRSSRRWRISAFPLSAHKVAAVVSFTEVNDRREEISWWDDRVAKGACLSRRMGIVIRDRILSLAIGCRAASDH